MFYLSEASPGTPCDENVPPSITSRSTKEGLSDAYVEALQDAGRYALWAPLLHEAFFLEEPFLLLGQISFDLTAEDQRGSWLLLEDLLTQHSGPSDEDGDDRQVFANTPITEEEQQAIDKILLQFLELQKQEDAENATRQCRQCLDALLGVQPVLESEVYHELRNMGECYWHGRDRRMRPLLVISLQRLQQLHREAAGEEKVTRLVIFCLEFFLRGASPFSEGFPVVIFPFATSTAFAVRFMKSTARTLGSLRQYYTLFEFAQCQCFV
ncbi:hypothetical protein EBH_0044980 [Eimeria brunetti]|uniref:CRAL-TRIO domain-containing protein n=1 Tax=Eimeria brunetti TaxID=51314 RepID=U6LTA3_9EIME|nr:hypothetical protein EBH_0044980 [Eimeria brunetti]